MDVMYIPDHYNPYHHQGYPGSGPTPGHPQHAEYSAAYKYEYHKPAADYALRQCSYEGVPNYMSAPHYSYEDYAGITRVGAYGTFTRGKPGRAKGGSLVQ